MYYVVIRVIFGDNCNMLVLKIFSFSFRGLFLKGIVWFYNYYLDRQGEGEGGRVVGEEIFLIWMNRLVVLDIMLFWLNQGFCDIMFYFYIVSKIF